MAYEPSFGALSTAPEPVKLESKTRFRVAVLGDFTGRATRLAVAGADDLGGQKPLKVTFEKLDDLPEKLGVKLRLPIARGGAWVDLEFATLDDFHPDQVFKQIDLFDDLLDLKSKLERSSSVEETSEKIRGWATEAAAAVDAGTPAPEIDRRPSASSIVPDAPLAEIAGRIGQGPAEEGETLGTQALLARAITPFLPADTSDSEALAQGVEKATAAMMREVLAHPHFQALEAAWRSLEMLVRYADKSDLIDVVPIDMSAVEFAADMAANDDLSASALHKLLVEKTAHAPDGLPWAAIVGLYRFDYVASHTDLLGRVGKLCQLLNAPFLAGMDSRVLFPKFEPDPEIEAAWDALRKAPEAAWLSLTTPGFLLRPPFGDNYKPAEQFSFEEFSGAEFDGYLWGNGGVAAAGLLIKAFIASGWNFKPGVISALDHVPVFSYKLDDDERVAVSTEMRFTSTTSAKVTKRGFMTLLAVRDRDSIEMSVCQALSEPTRGIAGKWEQAEGLQSAGSSRLPPSGGAAFGIPDAGAGGGGSPGTEGYSEPVKAGEEDDFWRPNDPEPEPSYDDGSSGYGDSSESTESTESTDYSSESSDSGYGDSSGDSGMGETPSEETPTDYSGESSDTPTEESPPADEPPPEETPVEETPAEEPVAEAPAEEPPPEDPPAEEPPAEETGAAVSDVDTLLEEAKAKAPWLEKCSPAIVDFASLLQPIPGDEPRGSSLPYDVREKLEEFRKEINPDNFAADDPMRPEDFKPAEWDKIEELCTQTLIETTKDLMVAARYTEALTKRHSAAGLRDGIHLLRLLVSVCWDRLSPEIEDDDMDVRAGPFNWLEDSKRGALFPLSVQMMPIVKDDQGAYSWYQWKASKDGKGDVSSEDFDRAVRNSTRAHCEAVYSDLHQTLVELNALDEDLGAKLGSSAPGLGTLKMAVNDVLTLAKQVLSTKPAEEAATEEGAAEGGAEAGGGGGGGGGGGVRLNSRADLYKALAEIADKLQRIEPHSPIPYLIKRACDLGNLAFPDLLKVLISDESIISQLSREFGLKQDAPPEE